MSNYRVFYNKDCAKYGVQRFWNLWGDCMGDRWQQVTLRNRPAYTKYEKVAERWLKEIKDRYNGIR